MFAQAWSLVTTGPSQAHLEISTDFFSRSHWVTFVTSSNSRSAINPTEPPGPFWFDDLHRFFWPIALGDICDIVVSSLKESSLSLPAPARTAGFPQIYLADCIR